MKKKTRALLKILLVILVVGIVLAFYFTKVMDAYSNQVADTLFQSGNIPSGNISIIQIDDNALEELGPYQTWTRDYVADALEMLSSDEDNKPAVVGVDVLYIGNSNEESDRHLVEAAKQAGNIVFGSFINVEPVLVEDQNGNHYMSEEITLYEEPFEELEVNSTVGFVNGFYDDDGVVRHGVKEVEVPDGRVVPSFSYAIYKEYAKNHGLAEDLSIPANSNNYWYIDYSDYSGGYSNDFSLSDLIQGEIPLEYFADGIVLIGPYAEGLMDSYHVAIDKSYDMYGVEIHANMIDQMIDGRFKKEVGKGLTAILIAIICAMALLIAYKNQLLYSIIYAVVFVGVYPLITILFYKKGIVLDPLYIPFFVFVITVCNIIFHYIRASIEKRKVEGTFKRYVAPEIVDEIMRQGMDTIKLVGEAVDCAILFVDIRGFTTMSESLEPEMVVSILNKYLNLTSSSIFKYGGTLDKFIGDATMAIFNAPIKQDDYIFKAVCAAMDMVEKSHALGEELEREFGRTVSFGVGVHCGKAVVGNIGTDRRMDYTAIGDTVNTSARLEANAPRDTVYISKKVVDELGDRITVESVGNIPLKGKSEELEVFKLLSINHS